MTEGDIEIILQAAREQYPQAKPRIISDNGPQFIARDFKEFIRITGMTHVRTAALLSAIERKNRTLAQVAEKRVHLARHSAHAGRWPTADPALCGPLQRRALA